MDKELENLLNEIIEYEKFDSNKKSSYWRNRFDELSYKEDVDLRSKFGELKQLDMISINWADNIPYFLNLKYEGENYFNNKKVKKKKIIISSLLKFIVFPIIVIVIGAIILWLLKID